MLEKTNIQQTSKWQRLKSRMRHTFRFQIIDEQTYDVLLIFELSLWNVILFFSTLSMALLVISFFIFSFSPLKYYTPGYTNTSVSNKAIIDLLQKTEDLEENINLKDKQLSNIKNLLTDKIKPEKISIKDKEAVESASPSLIEIQTSEQELKFRKQVEQQLQSNNTNDASTISWKLPVASTYKVLKNINGILYQFSLKNIKNINSVAKGTVVSVITNKGFTDIYILHPESYLSKYKAYGTPIVKVGDDVKTGTIIIEVKDKNSILQYELWHNDAMVNILEMI